MNGDTGIQGIPVGNASCATVMKAKMCHNHVFSDKWLTDIELKDWIKSDPDNCFVVIRTVCSGTMTNANKTGLLKHKQA